MLIGLIQSVKGLKSKNKFLREEGILPQDWSINSYFSFQPAGQSYKL